MPDRDRLESLLRRLDGSPYPAYRDLLGSWRIGDATLTVDHVQGDPFASPSRVRIALPTDIPADILDHPDRRAGAEDFLLREFGAHIHDQKRGSGKSGFVRVYRPGPEVTERSAVRLFPDGTVEVRFQVGLPARGRRILGRQAWELITSDLWFPVSVLRHSDRLSRHARSVEDQRALRRQLPERGLVAFVADDSVLPRASGIDPHPLPGAVPFRTPDSLAVTLDTPSGPVRGLGVPEGITLIAGGGFHGKSTLLHALQQGHLDHVPGDGRERVVSLPGVVKVRAEDGRRVVGVDISPFLRDLPGGRSTNPFVTEDASGSTSQAAALVEAVEAGAQVLLLDEDTSATNLLVRDERMRALIPRELEPITPLVERVRQVHVAWGVSTVLVIGGVGDYLAVADTVIVMEEWLPRDATEQAKGLGIPVVPAADPLMPVIPRIPLRDGLEPDKIRARDERTIRYGSGEVDLTAVEHILDPYHAGTVGEALRLLHGELVDGRRTLSQILDAYEAILDDEGVEALAPREYPPGDLVRPRRYEVAAALSRVRTLQVAE